MGLFFKKGDFRATYLDPTITRIRDAGLLDYFMYKWRPYKGLRDQVKITEQPLFLEHLVLPMGILSGGLILALISFGGEKRCVLKSVMKLNLC